MISIKQQKRFWSRVNIKSNDECWLWTHSQTTDYYGRIFINRKKFRAHRLAYCLSYGIEPGAFFVCHECDVPLCQNPRHLFLATSRYNTEDKVNKNRHPMGEKSVRSKLTNQDVLEIIQLYCRDCNCRVLAEKYNVDRTTINNIVNGRSWSHLTGIKYHG